MTLLAQPINFFNAGEACAKDGRAMPSVMYCGGSKGRIATGPFQLRAIRALFKLMPNPAETIEYAV